MRIIIVIIISIMCTANVFASNTGTPNVDAKGAILMEFDTGRVLYEKEADLPLANASTTKIMTAIVALEKCALTDVVTASKKAAQTPPVKMHLETGEKQTMEDLLYALMLESANDAAVAIAEHVAGSVTNFAELMNEKAKEIGAFNTEFVTPNGLDSGNHHSTARDMALIARYALKNKDFIKIIGTPAVQTPVRGGDFKPHSFVNKDRLLREYDGAIGIKTGYTGKAGHCFVGAAKRNGMLIISVVLASGWGSKGKEQKWVDTKQLLNYGFNNYKYVDICKEGDLVKTLNVDYSKGKTITLKLNNSVTMPLTDDEFNNLTVKKITPGTIEAPVKKGETVGRAIIAAGDAVIAEVDIIADSDIERWDFSISLGKILDNWINMDVVPVDQILRSVFS